MIFKSGTCRAFVNQEVDEDTEECFLNLHSIQSDSPGAGDGSVVLKEIIKYANYMSLDIKCHPWALNGEHDRLKEWYIRNGFLDMGDWFVYYHI